MSKKIGGGRSETLYQHRILPTSDNLIQAALSRFRHREMAEEENFGLCFCCVSAVSNHV